MADTNGNPATGASAGAQSPRLPMFYKSPEAVNPARHGTLSLVIKPDFGFAASAHAIPVMASEMPAAMRSYPIVFVGPQKAPVVITGLRQDENLFVEPDGSWSAPHYVPAYVRRYPFVLAEDAQQPGRLTLCIDRDSDRVIETVVAPLIDGNNAVTVPLFKGTEPTDATRAMIDKIDGNNAVTVPLFKGTEPTDATRGALEFCNQYQIGYNATRAMIDKIDALGLFVTRRSTVTLESKEVLNLTDFQVVDEAALNGLADGDFLELRKSGALALIYCHLASSNSWNALAYQAKLKKTP